MSGKMCCFGICFMLERTFQFLYAKVLADANFGGTSRNMIKKLFLSCLKHSCATSLNHNIFHLLPALQLSSPHSSASPSPNLENFILMSLSFVFVCNERDDEGGGGFFSWKEKCFVSKAHKKNPLIFFLSFHEICSPSSSIVVVQRSAF